MVEIVFIPTVRMLTFKPSHMISIALIWCFILPFVESDVEYRFEEESVIQTFESLELEEASCDEFFFGTPFPLPKGNTSRLIRLCQTQQHLDYVGPAIFATLFNVTDRIPVYTADVTMQYPNCSGNDRPESYFWNRVSQELCNVNEVNFPAYPVSSRLGSMIKDDAAKCGKYQALNHDYEGNWKLLGVDRGHLNPNSINSQDKERQIGTFTLTNAAPQFSEFNRNSWRQYECMTHYVILTHTPMERVYIITGTLGVALDENNNPIWMNDGAGDDKNPVKVPGYYWKAVCYPGNPWTKTEAWSYAILQSNTKDDSDSTPQNIKPVKDFSTTYFEDDLFDQICMNAASIGPIEDYFEDWMTHVNEHCPPKDQKPPPEKQKQEL